MFGQLLILFSLLGASLFAANPSGDCPQKLSALYEPAVEIAGAMGLSRKKAEGLLTGPERQHALDLIRTYGNIAKPENKAILQTVAKELGTNSAILDQRGPIDKLVSWVRRRFGGHPPTFLERNQYAILRQALRDHSGRLPPALQQWWLAAIKSFGQRPAVPSFFPGVVRAREDRYFVEHPFGTLLRAKLKKAAASQAKIEIDPNQPRGVRRQLRRLNQKYIHEVYDDEVLSSAVRDWAGEVNRQIKARPLYTHVGGVRDYLIKITTGVLAARKIQDPEVIDYVTDFLMYRMMGALPLSLTPRQLEDRIRNLSVTELHELSERLAEGAKPVEQTPQENVFNEIRHYRPRPTPAERAKPKLKTRGQPKTVVDKLTVEIPGAKPEKPEPLTFPLPNKTGVQIFEKDEELAHFIETGDAGTASWSRYAPLVAEKFALLASIERYEDIKTFFPTLEKYTKPGQAYRGYKSVRIDSQFRFIFHWEDGHIVNLIIDDYHGTSRGNFNLPRID